MYRSLKQKYFVLDIFILVVLLYGLIFELIHTYCVEIPSKKVITALVLTLMKILGFVE